MISDAELAAIMPTLPAGPRTRYLPLLQAAMTEFGIDNQLREAAFLSQLAHESVELRHFEEIASGAAYEGRRDLGNTEPGDGRRFRGHGPIQITGRANHKRYGDLLGVDLITHPELAAQPALGFRLAGAFWSTHGLNELADAGRFQTITRRINGGLTGYADRLRHYQTALRVLSVGDLPQTVNQSPDEVRVTINGQVVDCDAYVDSGRAWGWIRPVAQALKWEIVSTDAGMVTLKTGSKTFTAPLRIKAGRAPRGFVAFGELRAGPW